MERMDRAYTAPIEPTATSANQLGDLDKGEKKNYTSY